ncbi:MAG: alanine racemase [candidate division KSB1 bacterium]|nr:alanine racemase [candidate division KSB1 bacterium]
MDKMYRPAWIDVDLDALELNIKAIQTYLEDTRLLAVVKADAYGLGAVPVARLYEQLGVDYLGVVTLDEAVELRDAGIRCPVLNMGPIFPDQAEVVIRYSIEQMVYRETVAKALSDAASEKAVIHVKVDTGMSRYGVPFDSAPDFIRKCAALPGLQLRGVFSHLAMSDALDKSFAHLQIERLEQVRRNLDLNIPIWHMVNSGGALDLPQAHYDMVRVGLMTYGYFPSDHVRRPFTLKPAMHVRTRIASVREIHRGDSVGYGRKYMAENDETIAVLPVGYADGYSRNLSKIGQVLCRGKLLPVIGGLCMDAGFVKITELPDVEVGEVITLMGVDHDMEISPHFIADLSGTVSYEVMSTFGRRLPRVYVKDGKPVDIVNYLRQGGNEE